MGNIAILKRTQELLEEVPLGGKDVDSKVRHLLRSEYLRRLSQYRRADVLLTQKYGMSFDEFISRRIVRERGYGWDVESDAMEWETAVSGIKTMRRNIEELQEMKLPKSRLIGYATATTGLGVIALTRMS